METIMTELFMIRHGQASFHGDNYDILSPLGARQMQILAGSLVKAGIVPDAVFCGTLQRHRESLKALDEIFRNNGAILPEARFIDSMNEYDHATLINVLVPVMAEEDPSFSGILERLRQEPAEFQRFFRKVVDRWLDGNYPPGEVESWENFKKRVMDGIESIRCASPDTKNVFVITSGGPISVAAGESLGLTPARTIRLGWEIINASVTRFKLGMKGPVLSVFNAFSFLEEAGRDFVTYR